MKISVIGSGYVGLVLGNCLASLGNSILCVDIDENKIEKLKNGECPIYEPGLKEMMEKNIREKTINFTSDIKESIENSEIIFIAVGTPMGENHEADLRFVKAVAKDIGTYINDYKIIVDKSTVPVGTADIVKQIIAENMKKQNKDYEFDVISNPEFMKEGNSIRDFMIPDRIVVGTDSQKAREKIEKLYKSIARTHHPLVFTDIKSAEMIKYAANSMLALRISYMNELSRLAEKVGADIKVVAKGIGLDTRIGPRFLQAGIGYGGSCFPKDVQAFIQTAKNNGVDFKILEAVEQVNYEQKRTLFPKISKFVPELKGKKIAIWGLSYKPNTDDMREAPSLVVIEQLQNEGAVINAFDPEAMEVAKTMLSGVNFFDNPLDAVDGCDCLVVVTEWNLFRELDFDEVKKRLNQPNIVDGRNIYDPEEMKKLGFNYIGVGRGEASR